MLYISESLSDTSILSALAFGLVLERDELNLPKDVAKLNYWPITTLWMMKFFFCD